MINIYKSFRTITGVSRGLYVLQYSAIISRFGYVNSNILVHRKMAQKSITSFFKKVPKENAEKVASTKIASEKQNSKKRQRILSSSSEESGALPVKKSPEKTKTKKSKYVSEKALFQAKAESDIPSVEKIDNSTLSNNITMFNIIPEQDIKKGSDYKNTNDIKSQNKTLSLDTVPDFDYNPAKSQYHPIEDACWSRGERVPYLALARTLELIESTSARLRIIDTLANYYRSVIILTPDDLLPSVYLCLNQLAPAYYNLELGVADMYLMKAIGQCTGRSLTQVRAAAARTGDLGLVAEQARSTQRTMHRPAPLTIQAVITALREIAKMTGQASVNKKISKIQSLYVACRHSEARYLIRSLAGKLRIGLAEQSVLQALAVATATTPPAQGWPPTIVDASRTMPSDTFKARVEENALIIKTIYCECPNYNLVIPVLLKYGVSELPKHCKLTPGTPLKPMLAHPTKGVHEVFQRFEGTDFTCEWKYDGERAQIHVPTSDDGDRANLNGARIFSRNQEDNTSKYPDILGRLSTLLSGDVVSCVLDCEAVAFDTENKRIMPFQILSTRKRKAVAESDIKVQVCVFIFDLLYLNGKPLVKEPLKERRALLKEHFKEHEGHWQFAVSRDCTNTDEVQEFLDDAIRGSCEGLMVKTLDGPKATYEIARRSHNWLKLKKDYLDGVGDSLDLVVIGAYCGRGKRTGVFGGFLLACYDADAEEYQSICKIGTGFSDDDLRTLSEALTPHTITAPKNYYRYESSHEPDTWLSPVAVWEVRCADLSLSPAHRAAIGLVDPDRGVSLRFPRYVRVRDDKTPEQATSAQQVAEMYLSQDQVRNQAPPTNIRDDFY